MEKLRPWSEFLGRENSDHGPSLGSFGGQIFAGLDGRNRARVNVESLARVIAAIRIASVRWGSYLPRKHRNYSSQTLRSLGIDSNRAIGVHSFNIRSTWNGGMACES